MTAGHLPLDLAAEALRGHTDERWVEVADSLLSAVVSASRPSHPVRGRVDGAAFHVSEQVLTRYLLDAVDAVPDVTVDAVRIHSDEGRYTGVTIVLTARHGLPLIPAADLVRESARRRLVEVLGDQVPPVTVSSMHVHVDDVTPGHPSLG